MKKNIIYISLTIVSFLACKKDVEVPPNPFDDPAIQPPAPPINSYNPSPTSFEYLFHNVFYPTCANSNCHDGAFEPDFRTLSGAYNTLVYAPVTMTVAGYDYRVMPGNSAQSVLVKRLTQFPGNASVNGVTIGQGRMPFVDTLWRYTGNNETYIQNIISWIDGGAKDIFGNSPTLGNKNPNTFGLQVCPTGNATPYNRPSGKYIVLSRNTLTATPIDVWAYVVDDATAPENMVSTEIKFSKKRYDFTSPSSSVTTVPLSYVSSGNTYKEITNTTNVQYNFKLSNFSIPPAFNDTGYIFMRTYIKDAHHTEPAETPNNGTYVYSDYFIIKVTP